MARARRGRAFQPKAGAAVPQEALSPIPEYEETGAAQVPQYQNPAAQLGAAYSQQAAAAFQALGMIQGNRLGLENMDECPDDVLSALDDLEVGLSEVIVRTGKVIGELNEWAQSEQE